METTTKTQIIAKFEDEKYRGINFPSEVDDSTIIYLRSPIQRISHLNYIYKDGNKFYIEDFVDVCVRVVKGAYGEDISYTCEMLENAEYVLYLADYNLSKAIEMYKKMY